MGNGATRISVLAISVLLASCSAADALKARRIAREGNELYLTGDYRGAIAKYRDALALDPQAPNTNLNLGYALFNLYRPDSADALEKRAAREASDAFARHLEQNPGDPGATRFRIKTLLRAAPSDPVLGDQAYAMFTSMIAKNPSDEEARQYLVALFVDTKRYEQAVQYFSASLKKDPHDLATMKILGIIAEKSDRFEDMVGWYRRRAEITADAKERATLYYELGTHAWNVLHYSADKTMGLEGLVLSDLGIEATKRAIALQADYAEAFVYTNLLYLERASREPGDFGKEIDQRIAFDYRTKAAQLMKKKAPAEG